MGASVLLINPKTPANVGGVLRACSIFGATSLRWTGDRVAHTHEARRRAGCTLKKPTRLPREERLRDYSHVDWTHLLEDEVETYAASLNATPVCVEISEHAESLADFVHPENALYIFGPEDGHVPKGVRTICHRFVRIPSVTRTPLNLAAAVNVVLYDRHAKGEARDREEHHYAGRQASRIS